MADSQRSMVSIVVVIAIVILVGLVIWFMREESNDTLEIDIGSAPSPALATTPNDAHRPSDPGRARTPGGKGGAAPRAPYRVPRSQKLKGSCGLASPPRIMLRFPALLPGPSPRPEPPCDPFAFPVRPPARHVYSQ